MTEAHRTFSLKQIHDREELLQRELNKLQGYQNPVEARNQMLLVLAFHGTVFTILCYLMLVA